MRNYFPLLQEILSFLQEKVYIKYQIIEPLGALCGPSDMGKKHPRDKD